MQFINGYINPYDKQKTVNAHFKELYSIVPDYDIDVVYLLCTGIDVFYI